MEISEISEFLELSEFSESSEISEFLSGHNLDAAAASRAVGNDTYLGGDALAHGIGVADDTHFLALRGLQHGQRVDDRGQRVGIECAESLVDKQVVKADVARRQ